jgi:ribonuclease VapC
MIVADTSAIVAVAFAESERDAFVQAIGRADRVLISTVSVVGHAAALNFGDVFSYALAKVRGLPLLYKGVDFSETDIASALDP